MRQMNNALFPPPMSGKEIAEMVRRARQGDNNARACLVVRNMRIVARIARKYDNTGISFEDRISVGAIGLMKAVDSYNPDKNTKLVTYAARCIKNEILMAIRRVNQPTRNGIQMTPLEKVLHKDKDGNELLLLDMLGTEPDLVSRDLESEAEKQTLYRAIDRLDAREKRIIMMMYGIGGYQIHSQTEIASIESVSQSYVSRLAKRAVRKIGLLLAEEETI